MDALRNPYAPGAGTPPPELAGRDDILDAAQLVLGRTRRGRFEKSLLMIGLRGVGKTVLLDKIARIAREDGTLAETIEASENKRLVQLFFPALRRILVELDTSERVSSHVKAGWKVLRSFISSFKIEYEGFGIGIDPQPGKADSGDLDSDLQDLFQAVGEAAKDRNKSVVLLIDELQYIKSQELGALIMAIHKVAKEQLPFTVIGAGLPQLVALTGKSKSYAERLFQFPEVGPLSSADAAKALSEPSGREGVIFTPDALEEIFRVTEGYPYFLQEWGYHAWNIAKTSPITLKDAQAATIEATRRLDQDFFRVRFDRLTPSEKNYLRAMADLGPGPHRSGAIAEALGKDVQNVAPVRNKLIKKGMIFSQQHGETGFTVPLFDSYLKRIMDYTVST